MLYFRHLERTGKVRQLGTEANSAVFNAATMTPKIASLSSVPTFTLTERRILLPASARDSDLEVYMDKPIVLGAFILVILRGSEGGKRYILRFYYPFRRQAGVVDKSRSIPRTCTLASGPV